MKPEMHPAMIMIASLIAGDLAHAQTPLLDRYRSYFSTPFESATHQFLVTRGGSGPLPLAFVRVVIDPVMDRRRQDRLRIKRVVGAFGSPTGFEEVDGDGVVTLADLDALDDFVVAQVRALAPGFTDRQLRLPTAGADGEFQSDRVQALVQVVRDVEQVCIEFGCDNDDDGVDDLEDLCPAVADPSQGDLDADGVGDACDLDDDNDAIPDVLEACSASGGPEGCLGVIANADETFANIVELAERAGNPIDPALVDDLAGALQTASLRILEGRNFEAAVQFSDVANLARGLPQRNEFLAPVTWLRQITALASGGMLGDQGSVFDPKLCTDGDLLVMNNATVTLPEGCAVVADGNVTVFNNATLEGNLVAACDVDVRNNATVTGDVQGGGSVTIGPNGAVGGSVEQMPCSSCDLGVVTKACDRPIDFGAWRELAADHIETTRAALDGVVPAGSLNSAGDLVAVNNINIVLPAGVHAFRNLTIQNNATLTGAGGRVVIVVLDIVEIGNNVEIGNGAAEVALVALGGNVIDIQNNVVLDLTLSAPGGSVTMLGNNALLRGGLSVGRLHIENNNRVVVNAPCQGVHPELACSP